MAGKRVGEGREGFQTSRYFPISGKFASIFYLSKRHNCQDNKTHTLYLIIVTISLTLKEPRKNLTDGTFIFFFPLRFEENKV